MKVLKTHLPKVINELLCEPTVDDVLDHMQRDLREIGVEDFGVFRFTYEGLPLEKWLLGARVEKARRSGSKPEGRDWGGLVWQRHEQPLRAAQASLHHSGHLHGRLLSPERPRCSS